MHSRIHVNTELLAFSWIFEFINWIPGGLSTRLSSQNFVEVNQIEKTDQYFKKSSPFKNQFM